MNILGVSALYHDSGACLVQDGTIVAAAQEERFSRKKHDSGIPYHAIAYCLQEGKVGKGEIDVVVFYDKPLTKFTRLLTTYAEVAPRGLQSFLQAIPVWLKEKGWVSYFIERFLEQGGFGLPKKFQFAEHHLSHAGSAFFRRLTRRRLSSRWTAWANGPRARWAWAKATKSGCFLNSDSPIRLGCSTARSRISRDSG